MLLCARMRPATNQTTVTHITSDVRRELPPLAPGAHRSSNPINGPSLTPCRGQAGGIAPFIGFGSDFMPCSFEEKTPSSSTNRIKTRRMTTFGSSEGTRRLATVQPSLKLVPPQAWMIVDRHEQVPAKHIKGTCGKRPHSPPCTMEEPPHLLS